MRTYPSSEDVQGATLYYYPGRWIQFQDRTYSAQFPLPREHSLPSCLSWRSGKYIHNISFTSYRVPIYTPGWRAAMWIKCLAEGQKCQAWTGIEPATLWSRVKGSLQYTTVPARHLHQWCIDDCSIFVFTCQTSLYSASIEQSFRSHTHVGVTRGPGLREDRGAPRATYDM